MKPLCNRCAIAWDKARHPVEPEGSSPEQALLTVISEAPGRSEVFYGRPLSGQAGSFLLKTLKENGLHRGQLWLSYACACRPPGVGLKEYLAKLSHRKKTGKCPRDLLDPITACQPRLLAEVERAQNLLILGSYACKALNMDGGSEEALRTARGFPTEFQAPNGRRIPSLVSWPPSVIIRSRRFQEMWLGDMAKTARMVRRQLTWNDPTMLFRPTAEQLNNLLEEQERRGNLIAYDVETDGIEPLTANLRCIGIGSFEATACVPVRTVELGGYEYPEPERQRIESVLQRFFNSPGLVAAQNGLYDWACMRKHYPWWRPEKRFLDTAIMHHIIFAELPHNLEFLSAQYSDAYAHKDVNHAAWQSDHDLHRYCMLDVAITSQAASIMAKDQRLIEQKQVLKTDSFLSEFCREMHREGMRIDRDIRDLLYHEQTIKMEKTKIEIRKLAVQAVEKYGQANGAKMRLARGLNPSSPEQVATILYEACGVQTLPEREGGITESGNPAVGKSILYALMDRGLPQEIEDFLHELISFKEALKLRGTYCTIEPEKDGRVHASWSPHIVVSGRLSCSSPNLMNIPKSMRKMFIPDPGHVFVVRDKKQLEARITAWLAGEQKQIAAFIEDADIHKVNAVDLFDLRSVQEVTKPLRQFTKTLIYAIQYLASKRKAWRMIRCFRDFEGKRPYKDRSFSEIEVLVDRYWRTHAATLEFHASNRLLWRERGYLADAIHGRRRYFADGDSSPTLKEEQANMVIQTTAAADVNNATERLVRALPYGFDGPHTGVIHQCHDALLIECREESAERVAAIMRKEMDSYLGDMPLNTDCQAGYSYGELKEGKYE